MAENRAYALCSCCINYDHLKEKAVPGSTTFPVYPYCKKGHMEPEFGCQDFKTSRDLLSNKIVSLQSQIRLLEEKLSSKKE